MAKLKFDSTIITDLKTAAYDSYIDSLRMIEINDITPNEDNFYEMTEIEELADDIERQGLMSALVVAENDGKLILVSGHRRLAAIKMLIDEGRRTNTTVPCYVKSAKSDDETMLDLIMLNATQRTYTNADTMREYEELQKVFKALDAAGKPVKGKIREHIAKILNVSVAQIGKIDNIKHNAIPDVAEAVKSGEMSISTANEVAKLAPEQQKEIIEKQPNISHKEVKKMQKKPKQEQVETPVINVENIDIDEQGILDGPGNKEETIYKHDSAAEKDTDDYDEPEMIHRFTEPFVLSEDEATVLAKYISKLVSVASDDDCEVIIKIVDRLRTS